MEDDSFKIDLDETALAQAYEHIGTQIAEIVNTTFEETLDEDLDTAAATLHRRLNAVDGVDLKPAFSRHAIETLRNGDELHLDLT